MMAAAWPGVPGYAPERLLGRGGGGCVWGCVHDGARVAIKIAPRSPRLARELEAHGRLDARVAPRLLGCLDVDATHAGIVMEWLDGETLATRLTRGAWPFDDLAAFAWALAARIDAMHAAGIAHRDLKPANIWLEPAGVRLLDFGLALLDDRATPSPYATANDVIGTPLYMAPEQALGAPSGRAADIYSYGAIVFELITGRPPFDGAAVRVAHASRRAPAVSVHAPHAAMLDDVIASCLAKQPNDRPRSAGDVARMVAARLSAHPSVRGAAPSPRRAVTTTATVLLGIPSPSLDLERVAAATSAAAGVLARVRPDGVVIAFPSLSEATGVARAREVLAALDVAGTIETAPVAIQRGVRGVRVSGAAIDDVATWWSVATTCTARQHAPARADVHAPLLGRDAELAALVAHARAAVAANAPAIITIVGDAGTGTTRLMHEVHAAVPEITIVDAAHHADPAVLDALETSGGVVVAAAQPSLYARRPLWGDRVARTHRVDLGPLDRATTIVLFRHLLLPAEFVPASALAQLAAFVDGNPGLAVEIARQLHASGAIRIAAGGGATFAADELAEFSAPDLAKRLAARLLARLAPDVRRFAQIAAILQHRVEVWRCENMRALLHDAIETDAGVALARLAAEGILVERDGAWHVRHALLADAIVATLPPGERAELHRAALACVPPDELAACARHASGAGDAARAAALLGELGDRHRAAHADVDAERAYTHALGHVTCDAARARLMLGRGIVRCRLQRLGDADLDLAAAEAGEPDVRAEALLERATVADWSERWDEAARLAKLAASAATPRIDPARVALAHGRAAFRAGELHAARLHLGAAAAGAHRETATIAKMLLGTALVIAGDLDAARMVLDEAVADCEARGDRMHLCSALNDRMWLWIKHDALDRGIEDQRAATALARELGHPHLERSSTYNLAELLYWRGSLDEALPLARRSRSLQARFLGVSPLDALLVARIQAARYELADAARELAYVDEVCGPLAGTSAVQRQIIGLVLEGARGWDGAIAAARETTVLYELPEALWFAARTTARAGDHAAAHHFLAAGRALGHPSWNARFTELEPRNPS